MRPGCNTARPSPSHPRAGPVEWKQLSTARTGNPRVSVQSLSLKSTGLLIIVYVLLSTAEMNCSLNLFKYIQTRYNGGTWLTDSYDNDFPPVTFIAITESQYFTAEPIFTTLLS